MLGSLSPYRLQPSPGGTSLRSESDYFDNLLEWVKVISKHEGLLNLPLAPLVNAKVELLEARVLGLVEVGQQEGKESVNPH